MDSLKLDLAQFEGGGEEVLDISPHMLPEEVDKENLEYGLRRLGVVNIIKQSEQGIYEVRRLVRSGVLFIITPTMFNNFSFEQPSSMPEGSSMYIDPETSIPHKIKGIVGFQVGSGNSVGCGNSVYFACESEYDPEGLNPQK